MPSFHVSFHNLRREASEHVHTSCTLAALHYSAASRTSLLAPMKCIPFTAEIQLQLSHTYRRPWVSDVACNTLSLTNCEVSFKSAAQLHRPSCLSLCPCAARSCTDCIRCFRSNSHVLHARLVRNTPRIPGICHDLRLHRRNLSHTTGCARCCFVFC